MSYRVRPYRVEPRGSDPWPPRYVGRETHALERAWQRYGLRLMPSALHQAERSIQSKQAKYLGWDPRGRQIWVVSIQGKTMPAVYNFESEHIVTFLEESHVESNLTQDVRQVHGKRRSNYRQKGIKVIRDILDMAKTPEDRTKK